MSMSTEFRSIRKKRAPSDLTPSDPAPEGDHRKRRRNRTTQSCLNCHTCKRMCDRKRPCGRCTQLGLTGLCVYEVGDPRQESDVQDESSRLRQRVAELEGVIRELKDKPHPRWAESGSSPGVEFKKHHARARSCTAPEDSVTEARLQSGPSHRSSTNSNIESNEASLDKQTPSLLDGTLQPGYLPSPFLPPAMGSSVPLSTLSYSPYLDLHSPASSPSTDIMTPIDEHPQTQIPVAADQLLTNDVDLESHFMSYPGLMTCDKGRGPVDHVLRTNTHSRYVDPRSTKYNHGQFLDSHCGCLNEVASYNVALELSFRLRRAVDTLGRSPHHRFNNWCPLNRGVVDLDSLAMAALGNITCSPNDFGPMHPRSRANTALSGPIPPAFSTSCIPPIPSVPPPLPHHHGVQATSLL